MQNDLAFIQDKCCHLMFCLHLIEPHCIIKILWLGLREKLGTQIETNFYNLHKEQMRKTKGKEADPRSCKVKQREKVLSLRRMVRILQQKILGIEPRPLVTAGNRERAATTLNPLP